MRISDLKPHLQHCMCMMAHAVHVDPQDITWGKERWWTTHTWTDEVRDRWIDDVTDYLMSNAGARQELMEWPRRNKKDCRQVAEEMDFMWGWSREEK